MGIFHFGEKVWYSKTEHYGTVQLPREQSWGSFSSSHKFPAPPLLKQASLPSDRPGRVHLSPTGPLNVWHIKSKYIKELWEDEIQSQRAGQTSPQCEVWRFGLWARPCEGWFRHLSLRHRETQTCEEPCVSLQREILMNWLYFIMLIITEIRGGNERLGRSFSPLPVFTEQVSSVYFVGFYDIA